MEASWTLLLWALPALAICGWLWRAFDWRWFPGPWMLLGGLGFAALAALICGLFTALDTPPYCSGASFNRPAGLALGTIASGAVVLLLSPIIAFARRAAQASREG